MQALYSKLSRYFSAIVEPFVSTEREVAMLDRIFKRHRVKRVLDVACGVGRHSIELAKLGYAVTGIDVSPYQIAQARKNARRSGVSPRFTVKDANNFSYTGKFDAAICMWSTLGEEPMQYAKVMKNVYRALRKKGIFIIDNNSWEDTRTRTLFDGVFSRDGIRVGLSIHDTYTEHFRVRETKYRVGGKNYQDICITHLLRTPDWIRELKNAGFRRFEVRRRPKRALIVAQK